MKKLALLLFLVLLLTACQPAAVPQPVAVPPTESPPTLQEVVNSWLDMLNLGDIDGTLSYLAEDATVTIIPSAEGDGIYNGRAEIRSWYESVAAAKGTTSLSDCKEDGETITCLNTYADEGLKSMGVDFIAGEWVAAVRDGKIQSYTFTISPESLAKFPPPPESAPEPTKERDLAKLPGDYKTRIDLDGATYGIEPGSYILRIRDDLRWFVVDPIDDFIYVQGYFTNTADQIVVKSTGGPVVGSCVNFENTYAWTAEGTTLTFTPIQVDAKCEGEEFFFTSNPFTWQP